MSLKLRRVFSRLNRGTCARWCFAIPATGTLLLSDYSDDIASLYRAGGWADFSNQTLLG